jgi:hypothetical protein
VSSTVADLQQERRAVMDWLVLAVTLFAHDLAALGVHALAGLGDDGAAGRCGP